MENFSSFSCTSFTQVVSCVYIWADTQLHYFLRESLTWHLFTAVVSMDTASAFCGYGLSGHLLNLSSVASVQVQSSGQDPGVSCPRTKSSSHSEIHILTSKHPVPNLRGVLSSKGNKTRTFWGSNGNVSLISPSSVRNSHWTLVSIVPEVSRMSVFRLKMSSLDRKERHCHACLNETLKQRFRPMSVLRPP